MRLNRRHLKRKTVCFPLEYAQSKQFSVQQASSALVPFPRSFRAVIDEKELYIKPQQSEDSPENYLFNRIRSWLALSDLLDLEYGRKP